MASKKVALQLTPKLRKAIHDVRSDVFGTFMNINSRKSGNRESRKVLKGTFLARYYPEPIATSARKVMPGFETEEEERRRIKLLQLRRRGKGPPTKGASSKKKKKK